MNVAESIFNPLNDSLKEKVRAYYSVCQAYLLNNSSQAEKGLRPANYISSVEEIENANDVIDNSLEIAKQSVSCDDLAESIKRGFLTEAESLQITKATRIYEIGQNRKARVNKTHFLNNHKR